MKEGEREGEGEETDGMEERVFKREKGIELNKSQA